ncbi:unnamed protein product [Amoebophrya sp. A120]|nr:unnamed protein product [Amoebophrya sp. A120]|eukprot:GSA120T00012142001.1
MILNPDAHVILAGPADEDAPADEDGEGRAEDEEEAIDAGSGASSSFSSTSVQLIRSEKQEEYQDHTRGTRVVLDDSTTATSQLGGVSSGVKNKGALQVQEGHPHRRKDYEEQHKRKRAKTASHTTSTSEILQAGTSTSHQLQSESRNNLNLAAEPAAGEAAVFGQEQFVNDVCTKDTETLTTNGTALCKAATCTKTDDAEACCDPVPEAKKEEDEEDAAVAAATAAGSKIAMLGVPVAIGVFAYVAFNAEGADDPGVQY